MDIYNTQLGIKTSLLIDEIECFLRHLDRVHCLTREEEPFVADINIAIDSCKELLQNNK